MYPSCTVFADATGNSDTFAISPLIVTTNALSPLGPCGPCGPGAPCGPVAPVAP